MHAEARGQVLAALREVFDGAWTRNLGTDGGQTLHWEGKCGLIAGCTPTIDRHSAVMGSMGERFILVRLPKSDEQEQARKALEHRSRSAEMRSELSDAVADLFKDSLPEPPERMEHDRERLISLAVFVVRCRSAVEREGRGREIELIPPPEAPARLVIVLDRLLDGMLALGADRETAWEVVQAAALNSIPAIRWRVIQTLLCGETMTLSAISDALDYPRTTCERTLEDLVAHGVVDVNRHGQGKTTTWQISAWGAENHASATSPDLSGGTYIDIRRTHTDDISGEVGTATGADKGATASGTTLPLSAAVGSADPANGHESVDLDYLESLAATYQAEGTEDL